MSSGLVMLPTFRFVLAGFWVVMAVGIGLCLVYVVGSTRGRRAAEMPTLGGLFLGTMWFMALRYTQGLDD